MIKKNKIFEVVDKDGFVNYRTDNRTEAESHLNHRRKIRVVFK